MRVHLDLSPKGANIGDPIGHTQVLIRLHAGNFNFDTAGPDGADLRVIAGDDRTPLHFQIEKYDSLADQVALVWVDMPNLIPGSESTLFLYWGNKSTASASDPKATFSADQVLVYHFAGETGPPHDSTSFANDALSGVDHGPNGLVGEDAKFTGQNLVMLPKSDSLSLAAGAAVTWSMWVKPAAANPTQTATLFSQTDGTNGFAIGLDQGIPYAEITGGSGVQRATGGSTPAASTLDPTTWHLVVVTVSDKMTLYVDGAQVGQAAASLPTLPAGASLGGQATVGATPPTATAGYSGEIDEFEIARGVVAAGVIKLWMTEKNPEKFLIFDVAEENSILGNGYVGVIARSVTPDAWFVIGLLGLMSLISWWAMISKAFFLRKVSRANTKFELQYRLIAAPGATAGAAATEISLTRTPQLRASPLFRLYHVGMRELNQRLSTGLVEADGRLARQSIDTIRAVVDAAQVRESQRLGSTMVLLTICISGGPFLGLLGTVVGVMITFAAIAQAGDVNVNAIAPGVAAALLATVAGLAVAIPALFGYNYLLIRIREISTQMNAFANELVTGMGEQQRRTANSRGV